MGIFTPSTPKQTERSPKVTTIHISQSDWNVYIMLESAWIESFLDKVLSSLPTQKVLYQCG